MKTVKSECKITDWYRNIRKSRKVKVLLQTFGNPKFAPRDLKSEEQSFQLVSKIMLVSMKPIFQICLKCEGAEKVRFQKWSRYKIYLILKNFVYYKLMESKLVWLQKLIYVWECMKIEDAGRLDPPISWALILYSSKLLWSCHNGMDKSMSKWFTNLEDN